MSFRCAGCGRESKSPSSFFWLLGGDVLFHPHCKHCVRAAVKAQGLPIDVSMLNDADLRRSMDVLNILAHNVLFSDPARLHEAMRQLSAAFERRAGR